MLHQKSAQHTNSASATMHSALVDTVNRWQQLSIRVQFFIYTYIDIIYYLHYTLFHDPSVQSQRVRNIASDISL